MASIEKSVRKTLKTVEVEEEMVTLKLTLQEAQVLSAALGVFGGSADGLRGCIKEIYNPLAATVGVWGIRNSAIELGFSDSIYLSRNSSMLDIYKI